MIQDKFQLPNYLAMELRIEFIWISFLNAECKLLIMLIKYESNSCETYFVYELYKILEKVEEILIILIF